jgi:hypothetical protein
MEIDSIAVTVDNILKASDHFLVLDLPIKATAGDIVKKA